MDAWEKVYSMSEHSDFFGSWLHYRMKNAKTPGKRKPVENSIDQIMIVTAPRKFLPKEIKLVIVSARRRVGDEQPVAFPSYRPTEGACRVSRICRNIIKYSLRLPESVELYNSTVRYGDIQV